VTALIRWIRPLLCLVAGAWLASPAAAAPHLRAIPRHPRAGERLTVRLADHARQAESAVNVCLEPGAGRGRCWRTRLGPQVATIRLNAPRPGVWKLRVTGPDVMAERPLRVLPRSRRLSVLAIGDSLMSNVAVGLTSMLRGSADVRTDVLYAAGISKPSVINWIAHARRSERRWHPDVVVVFIGGNEGFSFGSVDCCRRPWISEFARRVRSAMRNFGRRGAAQVYWLSLPAPRPETHRETWIAENFALPVAARGLDPWTQVLDMSAIFTPGFVYRDAMEIGGELTTVRESDGIHLNKAGGALAAQAVLGTMRADGVLPSR
jgi:lysophospholipase L1-like esterase